MDYYAKEGEQSKQRLLKYFLERISIWLLKLLRLIVY